MDTDNAVVKLCADGMAAEGEGRTDDAQRLFAEAWRASSSDFEACVAAHYVARHQETLEETLRWNQAALRHADAVGDDRVRGFYPSLYLNVAYSFERLGKTVDACRHYSLAAARLDDLAADGYGKMVRMGIAQGQSRTCTEAARVVLPQSPDVEK